MKLGLVVIFFALVATCSLRAQDTRRGRPMAPAFPIQAEWINTSRPIQLHSDLKGHIVLLDFWTYCCINCLHILPDLDDLEARFRDVPFVVIGVHSAKFENENVPANVRSAVRRHHITHPVVVDTEQELWKRFGVRAWPTLILLDPDGRAVRSWSGEGNKEEIAQAIAELVTEGRSRKTLATTIWRAEDVPPLDTKSGLRFPGKVVASETLGRLFVADSSSHRVVEASWPGVDGKSKVLRVYGDGSPGWKDGAPAEAQFRFPQGLGIGDGVLWVADTDNHAIRRLDLASGTVSTLVGNGSMGQDRTGGRAGSQQQLNSPWDVAVAPHRLMIAMAGSHQLWRVDIDTGIARQFSGSGRENLRDGESSVANFAQPSGLAWFEGDLLVADSETSALRRVSANGAASTLLGEGLFDFGDRDGPLGQARLQHPLGIAVMHGAIAVADTYNSKIKRIELAKQQIESWTLKFSAEPRSLSEPGGISSAGGRWFVADTNHHRVMQVLPDGQAIEVQIEGLRPASRPTSRPSMPPR